MYKKAIIVSVVAIVVAMSGCGKDGGSGKKDKPVPADQTPKTDPAGPAEKVTDIKSMPKPILVRNPEEFLKKPIEKNSRVVVEYIVDKDGRVNAARIKESDASQAEDDAVLESVKASIYEKSDNRKIVSREIILTKTITRADVVESKTKDKAKK